MTFMLNTDLTIPADANAATISCDPAEVFALRLRGLLSRDPTIRVPLTGMGAALFCSVEKKAVDHAGGYDGAIQEALKASVSACARGVTVIERAHFKLLDTADSARLLEGFGLSPNSLEGQTILEITPTIDGTQRHTLTPLSRTRLASHLMSLTNSRQAFNGHELSDTAVALARALAFLRLLTSLGTIKMSQAGRPDKAADVKPAASQALSSYGVLLIQTLAAPDMAKVEYLRAAVMSDLVRGAVRDEQLAEKRAALIANVETLRDKTLLDFRPSWESYFAPRQLTFGGKKLPTYLLPASIWRQLDAATKLGVAQDAERAPGLASGAHPELGTWVVDSPFDSDATTSRLFDIARISDPAAYSKSQVELEKIANDLVVKLAASYDAARNSPAIAYFWNLVTGTGVNAPAIPKAVPLMDLTHYRPGDPADAAPIVIEGLDFDVNADPDLGLLKSRPIIPKRIGNNTPSAVAPLGWMYSSALPARLSSLGARQARYNGADGKTSSPVIPAAVMAVQASPLFASGSWACKDFPQIYSLWPRCWFPTAGKTMNRFTTADWAGVLDLPGTALELINAIARDAKDMIRDIAVAFRYVGLIFDRGANAAANPSRAAIASELLSNIRGQAPTPLEVIAPRTGFDRLWTSEAHSWPNRALAAASLLPDNADTIASTFITLDAQARYVLLPYTKVPMPIPFDDDGWSILEESKTGNGYGKGTYRPLPLVDTVRYQLLSPFLLDMLAFEPGVTEEKRAENLIAQHTSRANQSWSLENLTLHRTPVACSPSAKDFGPLSPTMGFALIPDWDVRTVLPMSIAAGRGDGPASVAFIEHHEGKTPGPRSTAHRAMMLLTDKTPEAVQRLKALANYAVAAAAAIPTDWRVIQDPSVKVDVEVL